ncbi:MAG: hypothetical protein QXK34_02510 [Candidatus Bathyarchaeia archaeon]
MQGRGNACELRVRFELPRDLAMALGILAVVFLALAAALRM